MNYIDLLIKPVYAAGSNDFIGNIGQGLPTGIPKNPAQTTGFLSSIIRFLIVIAGLFTLWQFLLGGLGMITSGGDKAKVQEAQHKITNALIGIVIIAGSFLIIGLASQLLFGDFTAILNPQLQTAQ